MKLVRRKWSPKQADEWTREDWIAIVLSPLAYVLLMVGLAMSMLVQPLGFVLLGLGIVCTVLMHWVIDPKLKAVSAEYEERQKHYLEDLERTLRWGKDRTDG